MFVFCWICVAVIVVIILFKDYTSESGTVPGPLMLTPVPGSMSLPDLAVVPCVSGMSKPSEPSVLGAKLVV